MYSIDPKQFGERLKDTINKRKTTQKALANEIGVSKTSITNYVNGRIPEVPILYAISDFLGVTMEWLLTGERISQNNLKEFQSLTAEDQHDFELIMNFLNLKREKTTKTAYTNINETSIETIEKDSVTYLPVIEDITTVISIESIEAYKGDISNSFIIRARGDSMIDAGIEDGDLVIFRAQPMVENGEIALVNVKGESSIRYFYLDNEKCELRSANPEYPPEKYSIDEINIIGKFVEVLEHK